MIELNVPSLKKLHFEESKHRFTVSGRWVPSVSAVGRQWGKPFDRDFFAAKVAKRRGTTPEEVIAEWEAKRDASVALGEAVHTAIELELDPSADGEEVDKHVFGMEREPFERYMTWAHHVRPRFTAPLVINGKHCVEFGVYHKELMYAGLADLIAETKAGIWVFDWKTNGEYETESKYNDKLLPPFEDLPACEHSEYSIQGSLLRMALESHGVPTAGSATAWLGPDGQVKIKVGLDMRERLYEVLKGRKRADKPNVYEIDANIPGG